MSKMFKCMCLLVFSVCLAFPHRLLFLLMIAYRQTLKLYLVRLSLRMAHQCGSEIRK